MRCLRAWNPERYSSAVRLEALAGLLGREVAISFLNNSTKIAPEQVLTRGVWALAEEIDALSRNEKMALLWGLASHVETSLNDDDVAAVVLDVIEFFLVKEKDLAIAFCVECMRTTTQAITGLTEERRMALLRNPRLNEAVARQNARNKGNKSMIDRLASKNHVANKIAEMTSIRAVSTAAVSQ